MNALRQFLQDLGDAKQIFVIGPLLKGTYVPQGPTIYVDGGIHARGKSALDSSFPTVSIGDGDSTDLQLDVTLPATKDYSDLSFVLNNIPKSVRHVELVGFLGGRFDHQLANFGEAHNFLRNRKDFTTVRFDSEIIGFVGGELKLKVKGPFSVMVLEAADVTIHGACQYSLTRPTRVEPLSSLGLSNVGNGQVNVAASSPVFVFFN